MDVTETGSKEAGENAARVLILDPDEGLKREVFASWSLVGTRLLESAGGQGALRLLGRGDIDILFLSTDLLTIENLDVPALARERNPGVEIFILAAPGDTAKAEEAVKRGAHSYWVKPVSVSLLESLASKALMRLASRRNVRDLQEHVAEDLLGSSPAMRKILRTILKVAPTNSTILISGESGTGKEFVSDVIHRLSPRAEENFVAVNCGAIPENLVEAELFGSKKGSYTGSVGDRKGLIEMADKGTLFLDEVGEMPLSMQAKLLRVLQDGMVRRVGSEKGRRVDVRLVTATHRSLSELVRAGRFREDLFYRLNVIPLAIPPLRERKEDILPLVRHFIARYAKDRVIKIAPGAARALLDYDWPGNVRQLENEVRRLLVFVEREITAADLALSASSSGAEDKQLGLRERVDALEKSLVLAALDEHGGNRTKVAEALGLSRQGLLKMMRRLGIAQE